MPKPRRKNTVDSTQKAAWKTLLKPEVPASFVFPMGFLLNPNTVGSNDIVDRATELYEYYQDPKWKKIIELANKPSTSNQDIVKNKLYYLTANLNYIGISLSNGDIKKWRDKIESIVIKGSLDPPWYSYYWIQAYWRGVSEKELKRYKLKRVKLSKCIHCEIPRVHLLPENIQDLDDIIRGIKNPAGNGSSVRGSLGMYFPEWYLLRRCVEEAGRGDNPIFHWQKLNVDSNLSINLNQESVDFIEKLNEATYPHLVM